MSLSVTGITLVRKGVQKLKKKKKFEVRSVDFLNLRAKFCKVLKIQGYVAQKPKS